MRKTKIEIPDKHILCLPILILLTVLALLFGKETKVSLVSALDNCFDTLIPSIFPMLFLSSLFSFTDLPQTATRFFDRPMRKIFGLGGHCILPMLLSLTQGYPIAVRCAGENYINGRMSKTEAADVAVFFTSPGLSFAVMIAGNTVYHSIPVGISLLASCILSDILLCCLFHNRKNNSEVYEKTEPPEKKDFSEMLVRSTSSAASSMLGICAWVLIFSFFSTIIINTVPGRGLRTVFSLLSEVTNALTTAEKMKDLPLTAFCLSFGGFCVFCQLIPDLKKTGVKPTKYLVFRIISAVIAGLTEKALLLVFPVTLRVTTGFEAAPLHPAPVTGSVSLFVLCLIFIVSLAKDNYRRESFSETLRKNKN